ncbi:MAG TPA: hypothetical protein VFN68_04115 [Acidimicrobiales bacterium]|nr:hypothetical protein [Acidimicrobiales bacterium]
MPAGAVAGWIRGRALLRRRLGPAGTRQLTAAGSVAGAVQQLAGTSYGHAVRPGMALPAAQRAVDSTLLWTLRILAGWQPPGQAATVRVLAGRFEIANTVDLLIALHGGERPEPFELGSLSTAWTRVRAAGTPPGVRSALRRSEWGDPGADDPGSVLLALQLAWAARVFEQVPPAAGWARDAVMLEVRHMRSVGAAPPTDPWLQRPIERVLGRRPRAVEPGAPGPGDRAAWWRSVEEEARVMTAGRPGPAATVGIIGLLSADAWRVRAALALAGAPAGGASEAVLPDAVA